MKQINTITTKYKTLHVDKTNIDKITNIYTTGLTDKIHKNNINGKR